MSDRPPHLQPVGNGQQRPLRTVQLVSGQQISVQGDDERAWFTSRKTQYLEENRFTLATDVQDLDRLLILELMVNRWTVQLASGYDYDGELANEEQLKKSIKEYSSEITAIKAAMGLNKATRDKAAQESVGEYISQLKARAKEFGVHRETQLTRALTLIEELSSLIGTHDRADAEERRKLDLSEHSILDWVRQVLLPEYRAVDEHFRTTKQRYWVRTL